MRCEVIVMVYQALPVGLCSPLTMELQEVTVISGMLLRACVGGSYSFPDGCSGVAMQ